MASLQEVETAFMRAHEAGDSQAASVLAQEVKRLRAVPDDRDRVRESYEGALRGAAGIGNVLLSPVRAAAKAVGADGVADYLNSSIDAQRELDAKNADSNYYGGTKLATEVGMTWPVGGVIGKGINKVAQFVAPKVLAPLADAVASYGMRAGGTSGVPAVATRLAGGAISGGATAGLVNPDDAAKGAAIGAVTPYALQGLGAAGRSVYTHLTRPESASGSLLTRALDISPAQASAMASALQAAPDAIVPGSKLTVSQALQSQGANHPSVKMLERIAAGGPGGDALLSQYDAQGLARLQLLQDHGAQTYLGAAKEEATRTGDRIGAVLRTQASDDREAAKTAWEALYSRAGKEGVSLHLPLDEMSGAMRPLGAGTVGAGKDAQALVNEAQNIGTMELPAIGAVKGERQTSLLDAVKAAGGINENTVSGKAFRGELKMLRQGNLGRVVYKNKGQSADRMAEKMHEAGFLPDDDPSTLIDLLQHQGRDTFAMGADRGSNYQAQVDAAMGGVPGAERIPVPVPFDQYQRLMRSAGALGAKVGERAGGETEAGVLGNLKNIMLQRVNDAADGVTGDAMSKGFRDQYIGTRDLTSRNAQLYKQNNNIGSILRRPMGQDYALTGDEITNKVWHGGAGLAGDVATLRNTLNANNSEPTMDALRQFIMTDAASKTKGSGQLGAALPRYVETRMPGLLEALKPEQLDAVSRVAADIKNADAAAAVSGLLGSDTQSKITRALSSGLLDSGPVKAISKAASVKAIGLETVRSKLAEMVVANRGKTISALLADPKAAAAALQDSQFVQQVDFKTLSLLAEAARRRAPLLAVD